MLVVTQSKHSLPPLIFIFIFVYSLSPLLQELFFQEDFLETLGSWPIEPADYGRGGMSQSLKPLLGVWLMVVPAVCLRARGKRPSGCILCGGQLNPRRGRKYALTGVGPESNSNKNSKFTPLSQSQLLTCFVRSIPCLSSVVFALPWASSWASEVQHCDSAKSGLRLSAWLSKAALLHGIFAPRHGEPQLKLWMQRGDFGYIIYCNIFHFIFVYWLLS